MQDDIILDYIRVCKTLTITIQNDIHQFLTTCKFVSFFLNLEKKPLMISQHVITIFSK